MYFNLCKHFVDNIAPIHIERGFCLPWGENDYDNNMIIFKLLKYQSKIFHGAECSQELYYLEAALFVGGNDMKWIYATIEADKVEPGHHHG